MLRRRIIPCLDVSGGRVVKGVEFVNLRDCGEPVDAAAFVYKPAMEGLIDNTEARVKYLAPMRP